MLNVQTTYAHHQQPNALAEARNATHPGFYSGSPPESQMVGYPESSQRTLLHDASSYANLYNVPYNGVPFSYQSGYSTSGSSPSDELQGPLDSQSVVRSSYRGVQGMSERRSSYALASQYLDGRTPGDLYTSSGAPAATAARLASHSAPSSLSQLGGSPGSYSAAANPYGLGSPGASTYAALTSDATALMDVHSPRSSAAGGAAAYPGPLRRDSMDSISDPISPSSVPGLVFDADDYDDDSESSLPSAASETVQRGVPYRGYGALHSQAADADRDFEAAVSREWGRASMDSQFVSGGSPVSLDDGSRQHGRSPEPSSGGDTDQASPVTPEGPQGERGTRPPQKKSKMHQCTLCFKLFPRPSGLATHMNSHSGAKRE